MTPRCSSFCFLLLLLVVVPWTPRRRRLENKNYIDYILIYLIPAIATNHGSAKVLVVLLEIHKQHMAQMQAQGPIQVLQLVIVGKDDVPIFDADLTTRFTQSVSATSTAGVTAEHDQPAPGDAAQEPQRPQYLYHFVLHAALDAMDDAEWATKDAFLGIVDRFNNLQVSGYITPGNRLRLMLLHDGRSEENVKTFFRGVHQLLVPLVLNPFFLPKKRIHSVDFYSRVRRLSKSVFGV